jgi:small GTP-binding protein
VPNKKTTPLVALVGLPNSGKSTLINRLGNTKKSIVANEAHTTRDLIYSEEIWDNMYMRFVDTGGLIPDPSDKIQKMVQIKTWSAIAEADLLIWVLDRRTNPEVISLDMLQRFWKSGKPFIIGINKVDNPNNEKSIVDYARFGGLDFINFSASNGYNLGELMDIIVTNLEKIGFEKHNYQKPIEDDQEEKKKKRSRHSIVKKNSDGTYLVVRESDSNGPGMFKSISKSQANSFDKPVVNNIENIITDLSGVLVFEKSFEAEVVNEEYLQFLIDCKSRNKKLYYLSNLSNDHYQNFKSSQLYDMFDGGLIGDTATDLVKPNLAIYEKLLEIYELQAKNSLFTDDKIENVKAAIEAGMWAIHFDRDLTIMEAELEKIQIGKANRVPQIPKILFLGKPNVGKSSLFNAMIGQEIQIVTEIPGTTLSINDMMVERKVKKKIVPKSKDDIKTDD